MTNPFGRPSEYLASSFFKPADHMLDLALIVEPKQILKDQPNEYQGRKSLRDEAIADVTVFANSESLDKGEPTEVLRNCKIVHGMLVGSCEQILNSDKPALLGVVQKIPTKNGSGYAFRDTDTVTTDKVIAYWQKRDEKRAAAAEDMPDF